MPKLTVEGVGQYEVPLGKRLVLALEQDAGIDQLHAVAGTRAARHAAWSSSMASPTA
jgi:hypothetical protein